MSILETTIQSAIDTIHQLEKSHNNILLNIQELEKILNSLSNLMEGTCTAKDKLVLNNLLNVKKKSQEIYSDLSKAQRHISSWISLSCASISFKADLRNQVCTADEMAKTDSDRLKNSNNDKKTSDGNDSDESFENNQELLVNERDKPYRKKDEEKLERKDAFIEGLKSQVINNPSPIIHESDKTKDKEKDKDVII